MLTNKNINMPKRLFLCRYVLRMNYFLRSKPNFESNLLQKNTILHIYKLRANAYFQLES